MGKLEGVAWACVLAGLLGLSAVLVGCDGYEIETVGSIDGLGFDTRATAGSDAGPESDLGPRGPRVDDFDDASTGSSSSSSKKDGGSTPSTPPTPATPKPKTSFELAQHWAPVWYQDTDDRNYEADYFTRYDYDGNTRGDDNWENLKAGADLRATVYFSHIETNTHHFLLYANFHPRDWDKDCSPLLPFSEPCHENDMEGAMVVLRKVSYLPYGRFEVLYTEAHNTLHIYTNDTSIKKGSSSSFESNVRVTFEGGSHPELYVESKGHGVCALYHDGDKHCQHDVTKKPLDFPGGDGVVYRYKGVAEAPKSGNDRDVGYSLRSLQYSLWPRRTSICDGGCTFDKAMTYAGLTLGTAFDGDSYGNDKANPPWAWDDPSDGPVYRGDFFFRPAKALASHLVMSQPISQTYLVNAFLPKAYW